ncbi:MAG TPA: TetR family transcriptional regulator [Thermoleophilaceae bacterium]|nr:TetR family transcriptional regulator [Thermoleophilaceae bacterium]
MPAEVARRPGRPSTGARERILEAGLEVLKADGYAGLTTAKVAARSGQNKALIAYHFGSKQGLVAAVAREVAESITEEVLSGLGDAEAPEAVVRGVLDGLWRVMDRDERIARLYFDLAAVSVVERDVRTVMRDMRSLWRDTLIELVSAGEGAVIFAMAALDGLALERLERGEGPALDEAKELFVRSAVAALREPARTP